MSDKILNYGTSEGLKKSWEIRKENWHRNFKVAADSSKKAWEATKSGDHEAAAAAHEKAAGDLKSLMTDDNESHVPVDRWAKDHEEQAKAHRVAGQVPKGLPSYDFTANMKPYEQVLNRINNAGTSEGVKKAWEKRHQKYAQAKSDAHDAGVNADSH